MQLGRFGNKAWGLKLNRTHKLPVYADHYLLGDNTDNVNKNTITLTGVNKKVRLEVKAEKIMHRYMFLSRYQNAGLNRDIQIVSRSSQNGAQYKYMGSQ
jgi:hypothetical protein